MVLASPTYLRSTQVPMSSDLEPPLVHQSRSLRLLSILVFSFVCLSISGCKKQSSSSKEPAASEQAPRGALELVFPYGSEKEKVDRRCHRRL